MRSYLHRLNVALVVGMTAIVVTMIVATAAPQSNTPPNPYRRVAGWAQVPASEPLGQVICVDVDAKDNLWVFHRGTTPILQFDPSGRIIKGFGAGMFVEPHGMAVDSQGNLWVTDNGRGEPGKNAKGHQVFKFSPDGKVLMTLGTGVAAEGADTFIAPTDVVVAQNGDIFVSDGHGDAAINYVGPTRVVKFSKDGTFIKAFGKSGSGPGELAGTHGIAMDSRGRIFVADRGNSRIDIFDPEGRFIDQWKQFGRPSGVSIDKNDTLYVADSESNDKVNPGFKRGLYIGSAKDGRVTAFLPNEVDPDVGLHAAAADSKGSLYVGAVATKFLAKYVKR